MVKNVSSSSEKLKKITDALTEDVVNSSDDEILSQAVESFGSIEEADLIARNFIDKALEIAGKKVLVSARKNITNSFELRKIKSNLSIQQKRELIDRLMLTNNELTLAARKGTEQTDDDVDSLIEDLIELGEIDENGNIK